MKISRTLFIEPMSNGYTLEYREQSEPYSLEKNKTENYVAYTWEDVLKIIQNPDNVCGIWTVSEDENT